MQCEAGQYGLGGTEPRCVHCPGPNSSLDPLPPRSREGARPKQAAHAAASAEEVAAAPPVRTGGDDDAASNASSDYGEPHGFRELVEHRYRKINKWIDRNRKVFDFVAYFFFLLVFTLVASEANPGEHLIEQVRACCCLFRAPAARAG